jgi:hypothetical protein
MRRIAAYPVWVGHAGDLRDATALLDLGIRAVVDLAAEEPPATLPREMVYCRYPLIDGPGNARWLLRSAVEAVANLIRLRARSLVACGAGMSRSPAIAGAALAIAQACPLAEGLAIVTSSGRCDISPGLWSEVGTAFDGLLSD